MTPSIAMALHGGAGVLMPGMLTEDDEQAIHQALLQALKACQAQVYLVSNEIGLGLIPLGQENRAFVDALGMLNQRVAAACSHVTLMAAGLPLPLKRP